MTAWLKTFKEGNTTSPRPTPGDIPPVGTEINFLEPANTTPAGEVKLRLDGLPNGEPGYQIGDLIAVYWAGSRQVTEVWEVIAPPGPTSATDWAWETLVKLRAHDAAVPIADIGVESRSLARRIRLRLNAEQETLVRNAFNLGSW